MASKNTEKSSKTSAPTQAISFLREKFRARFNTEGVQTSDAWKEKSVSLGLLNELNSLEFSSLIKRNYVTGQTNSQSPDDAYLSEMARTISSETMSNIADAERMKALDPTIERVKNIVVSSIMSPNDVQDVDPDIVVTCQDIQDSKKNDIGQLLQTYYSDIHKLRDRMTNWVSESQFRSGAGVTIIIPEATLTDMISTYDPDRELLSKKCGTEACAQFRKDATLSEKDLLNLVCDDEFYQRVLNYSPYKNNNYRRTSGLGKEGIHVQSKSTRQHGRQKTDNPQTDKLDGALKEYIKSLHNEILGTNANLNNKKCSDELMCGLEAIAINFKKNLQKTNDNSDSEQRYIDIVDNPDILRFGRLLKRRNDKKLHDLYDNSILGKLVNKQQEESPERLRYSSVPILDMNLHATNYQEQFGFPLVLDVPTESVIPICIPGNRKEKLGYFVLIDEYGRFVESTGYIISNNENPTSNRLSVAYNAMYGESPTASGILTATGMGTAYGNYITPYSNTSENISKIFEYILDEMLKKKLEDIGLNDVTIGRYNSIAQCMLYRLLAKKKTKLIFIPEKYVTYVAFDYHLDGTGKSKIEDILYMESLKTSFLTSNILAVMKNAVPIKKVKLNLDPKQKNTMQAVMMVRDALIRREKLTPTTWPASVTSQIIAQNLSIEMSHPNSEGFSYTVEDTHREIPKADTEFLEELNNSIITGLGVMPSALSESSEVQFAQSLATTNLYYARTIRKYQVVLEEFATRHVRNHLILSSALLYKIANILADAPKKTALSTKDRLSNNQDDLSFKSGTISDGGTTVSEMAGTITDEQFAKILKVIDSIEVKLTPPDIAPDNAQYNILTESIKRINEYVDSIYSDDMVSFGNDVDLSNAYKIFKASVKATMIRNVANTLGFKGLLANVPELDEYLVSNGESMTKTFEYLNGLNEKIKRQVSAMTKKSSEDDNNDNSSSSPW